MCLENSLRMLWLHLIQISSQLLVMLTQLFLSNNLIKFIIFGFVWVSLSSEHESHLLLSDGIWAFFHDVLYEIHVIHFLSNSKSIWVLSLA